MTTISEAGAINRLVQWILGEPETTGQPPTEAEAHEAAAFLADRAYRVLGAGLTAQRVTAVWERWWGAHLAGHTPRHGDAVATWLLERRDLYDEDSAGQLAVDELLADYRAHAARALRLDQIVPDGGERS